ncbi:adenine deaminase, partial [Bacteroidota bacterium]
LITGGISPGTVYYENGKIIKISHEVVKETQFILPGLIDAHIHIESSMLIPSEFARIAVTHGTVASVSDPHEIANVLGVKGVDFMINNGDRVPFKFYFGASSCVPATNFETSGATFDHTVLDELLSRDSIKYMSEMMNYPGVLFQDEEVMKKIQVAKNHNKPIDGHAPGLKGEDAKKYIEAGISTDHECFTMEEALDKVKYGMKILIREGSAAKNFDALIGLLGSHPDKVMFCSDDRHPNDLVKEHINGHVKRAIALGYDPITVLRAATLHPVRHYGLEVGLLQQDDDADFIIVDNLQDFNILSTYIKGEKVAENGKSLLAEMFEEPINHFGAEKIKASDLIVKPLSNKMRVIGALDGQLVTENIEEEIDANTENLCSMVDRDILKLAVLDRYRIVKPSHAFIHGIGIKEGAIASSVAHDSHNIIATGSSDEYIAQAINLLVESKGGISIASKNFQKVLPLPIAGLMSSENGYEIASKYEELDALAKKIGSHLHAPYMTLSFMALLVIPSLKLSDKGLFDGKAFKFTDIFII